MRRWQIITLVLLAAALAGLLAWGYVRREALARQWHVYRLGTADSFEQAEREIAWFETGPQSPDRLRALVRRWGAGNARFDLFLACHVQDPRSSDSLRESFAGQLGRRPELLRRWAHYWSYRAKLEPDRQVASILGYLDTLASAERPKRITWREVLDVQAVFELIGSPRRARGLTPENWQDHYRVWQEARPARLPPVARPANPFADWEGRLPK
jgi:hypothetical protein